jgi:hypothetical protein
MNQILLEIFCFKNIDDYAKEPYPSFCCSKEGNPSYNCLLNGCKYLSFTTCENTLCYVGANSDIEYGISFGGEMLPDNKCDHKLKEKWRSIALSKIDEAYDNYMGSVTDKK